MTDWEGLRVSILASGSTGNALYIESKQQRFLVDAGLSCKKIVEALAEIQRRPEDLDALFVTHEHSDHVKGIGVLARKYQVPIYANEKTWQAMPKSLGDIPQVSKNHFELGKVLTFGDVDVESFGVSHDAAQPQFYRFYAGGKSFVVLTDTGYCNDRVKGVTRNADAYLIESNHDVEMLRAGGYPWHLKQRILGDEGHLSNEDGALVMTEIMGDATKKIFLGHLSKENNIKELAHMTMEGTLLQHDIAVGKSLHVYDTDPEQPTALFEV